MFQDFKFHLIANGRKPGKDENGHYVVNYPVKLQPFYKDLISLKSHHSLEIRLAEELPANLTGWALAVSFSIVKNVPSGQEQSGSGSSSDEEDVTSLTVNPFSLSAKGIILQKLHSFMTYDNPHARLKLKLDANLYIITSPNQTEITLKAVLRPRLLNGKNDHSEYYCSSKSIAKTIFESRTTPPLNFKLENVRLTVEGIEYSKTHYVEKMVQPRTKDAMESLVKTGLGSDVRIRCQEESDLEESYSPIYFPGNILFDQSSVIKAMLNAAKFKEGATREIKMMDRSRDEVMAFLGFLYFGDLSSAKSNASLAVTLYEMGHYYDVAKLEEASKTILLCTPAASYGAGVALRLFHISGGIGDMQLKQMAIDRLKMCTDDEIMNANCFGDLFKSGPALLKELFVMSRKF